MRDMNEADLSSGADGHGDIRQQLLSLRLEAARRRRQASRVLTPRGKWGGPIPLSFAQERLWFLEQTGLVGATYNIALVLRLSGELDDMALERAFASLVQRHEALRTHFAVERGIPHQIIDPPADFALYREDLSLVSDATQRERLLQEYMEREQQYRFNLSQGPLFRVVLVRLNKHEHDVLITMHHIVSDGWSVGIMVRELSELYAAHQRGESVTLPDLTIQYPDFSIWQRTWLQGHALEEQLAYWRRRLLGSPPQLQLPTDRARPPIETFKGGTVRFHLRTEFVLQLEELGREQGATLFMVLLSVYQILLSRWSAQEDIVVGSPIAGRNTREIEKLIGFFVNTLVLRTEVRGALTFRQLLEQVRDVTLGAYAHQDLPFEMLVKELRPERNLARQSMFQVMLAVQNYPEERLDLADLTWKWGGLEYVTTHFDLTLYLYQAPDGLSAVLEYASDLFNPETIERFAVQFQALLHDVLVAPDSSISTLSLVSDTERQRVIVEWNATQAPYPAEKGVHELVAEQVKRAPDAAALTLGECTLSYGALDARANRLAHRLQSIGLNADGVVGVYLERSIEMIVAFLGILKAGGAYLPVDPSYPDDRVSFMLREAGASVVVTALEPRPCIVDNVKQVVHIDNNSELLPPQPTSTPPSLRQSGQLAYVLYTSGSTGRPKAVGVSHRNITRLLIGTNYVHIDCRDVFLQLAAPAFDASTFEIWGPLLSGGRLVLYPEHDLDLERLQQVLEREQVTILWLTAGLFHQVIDERASALSSLKYLLAGGDALSPIHVKRALERLPTCQLINGYGPTEATTFSVCHAITRDSSLDPSVPIGRPIANTSVYVLDSHLQPVPIGIGGELYIGGDGLARGYLHQPALTAERFVASPFEAHGARLYRTGDLARWRLDGTLEFLGRVDFQVKIRGYRVEPAEIESVLLEHPAVKQAVVLARQDSPGDRRLVAYVIGDRGAPLESAAAPDSDKLRNVIVNEWEKLYEDTYGGGASFGGPSFVGWNSSYTGEPIPQSEMQEWLANTIARIHALNSNRILEIGCGVGLLLQHLAPHCLTYVGTDFSAAALDQLRVWMATRDELAHVELIQRSATELQELQSNSFDAVVLNSVVQYFPDLEYVLVVLREAVRLVGRGGRIFIGDVRHLGSLSMFHSAVQLSKASDTVSVGQLKRRVARAIAQDKELVIDPQFFRLLPRTLPGISTAEVRSKRGFSANELTRYRYDVTLHVGESIGSQAVFDEIDWRSGVGSADALETTMQQQVWRSVCIRSIPNQRLLRDETAQRLINTSDEQLDARALRRQLNEQPVQYIDPESIWQLAESHGYDVALEPADPGFFDATLTDRTRRDEVPQAVPEFEVPKEFGIYANDPLEHGFRQQLVVHLREYLKDRLPDYMHPSAWLVLRQLPLTTNGKVDRRALPAPQGRPEELGEYVAPRTDMERTLAEIWIQLLPVDQVGVYDNFFELGGHSLLIMQLMERLRRMGLSTSVRSVYQNPTLQALARTLSGATSEQFVIPENQIPAVCEAITPQMLAMVDLQPTQIEWLVRSVPGGAANVQDIYPLAPLQEGILFHHLLNENKGDPYVLVILLSMSSQVTLDKFTTALSWVMRRHDALRSAVLWEQLPRPVQVVHRQADLPVEKLVLPPGRDPIGALKERMSPEYQRLDLRRAPLMRLQVAANPHGKERYVLLQLHHLICDHESMETMIAEVIAHMDGQVHVLPEPIPYRNHVARALMYADTGVTEGYFKEKLQHIDEPTAPFGLLDVYSDGAQIKQERLAFVPAVSQRIRAVARTLGVSAATLFHAAWALVVSATSGRDDVVFGTVLLGRLQGTEESQRTLGMFINTLPLRINLQDITTRELVDQTQRELAELLSHEQASLTLAQRCSQISGVAPLFTTLLNYRHSAPKQNTEWTSLTGIDMLQGRDRTNYPITLSVDDLGDGFALLAQTDPAIDPQRITTYLYTSIQSLLEALERSPHKPALTLNIVPKNEAQQITEEFNQSKQSWPQQLMVHQLFEKQVRRTPGAVAVLYEGHPLTYGELDAKANQLARYLRKRGIGPDCLVGICMERSLEMVVGLLGILKAGGAYVPLDPSYPPDRVQYMLADAAPRVLLTQARIVEQLPSTDAEIIALDTQWDDIAIETNSALGVDSLGLCTHHLAYVIYTSGSTGKPKGAMNEHRSVVNRLTWMQNQYQLDAEDRVLQKTPFSFDVSVWEFFWPLITGARLVVARPEGHKDPAYLSQLIEEMGVTTLHFVPSMLQSFLDHHQPGQCPSLRHVVCSGEELSSSLQAKFFEALPDVKLSNLYGPTEAAIDVTAWECSSDDQMALVPIGRPISNVRMYVLNRHKQPTPLGVAGEIYIAGAGVGRGYLNRPELTAERFVADPFGDEAHTRAYRTGDLGRWKSDGTIEYLGRTDHQVKIRGFRIELGEIEVQLRKHPQIKECVVVAREDEPGRKALVGYFVPKALSPNESAPTAEQLRVSLKNELPDYMVPSTFVMLDQLPISPNGKLDRRRLPAPEHISEQYEAPQGAVEEALAELWQQVLRVQRIGRHDNFFDLGGHSLLAMRVITRIRTTLSIELPIRLLFELPTIKELSFQIDHLLERRLLNELDIDTSAAEDAIDEVSGSQTRPRDTTGLTSTERPL